MANYQQKEPSFQCVQWTGSNQTEVTELYDLGLGSSGATWRPNEDGGLDQDPYGGAAGPMWRPVIPQDHWVVVGPYWGEPTTGMPPEVMTDAVFRSRFEVP